MRMILDRTPIATAQPFELAALRLHFRVDHDFEDDLIIDLATAAAVELEDLAQVALLTQTIRMTIFAPRRDAGDFLRLPIGPMASDTVPTVILDGEAFTDFETVTGGKPGVRWGTSYTDHPRDKVVVEYIAGFGTAEADIPRDLSMALSDQALMLFDARGPTNIRQRVSSPHMARVAARYRGVQA